MRFGVSATAAAGPSIYCRSISRSSQDLHTRTSYEHPRRTFIQAPIQSIFKILMRGSVEEDFNRISTRSSDKDLHRIMQGPLREEFIRISTRFSYKDLYKIMQGPVTRFHEDLHNICSQGSPQDLGQDLHTSLGPPNLHPETLARPW